MKKEYEEAIEEALRKICGSMYKNGHLIIYHYTSPTGLQGILSSHSFRFTKKEYLNDSTEMNYFFEVLEMTLDEKSKDFDKDFIKYVKGNNIKGKYHDLKEYTEKEYYVCCFSNAEDELSLWNYYTKSSSKAGYNLGVNGHDLIRSLNNAESDWNYHLGNVTYLTEDQIEILYGGLIALNDYYVCALNEHKEDLESYLEIIDISILEIMENCAPFFKHPAFKNEEECRIICSLNRSQLMDAKIEIRESDGIFVPYLEVKVNKDIFEFITIYPYIKSEMKVHSINELCKKYGYEVRYLESGIPVKF